ncbi:AraC family transcriptional regulator [Pseudomonas atacamensis]|nr:AraC family transcriptional regulator [Pseudomonas atacamensis]
MPSASPATPTISQPARIAAEAMPEHLPGVAETTTPRPQIKDAVVQLFRHQTLLEPIRVPCVAEPLLVLVLAGTARVEERSLGGEWQASQVTAGDFFLTNTREPYEMRWQTEGCEVFEVMHLYLGLGLIEQAAREAFGEQAGAVTFVDVSGERDEQVSFILEQLRIELTEQRQPSALLVHSLAQALAIHLLRHYLDPGSNPRRDNALPAYKLRRVLEAMNANLAEDFSLSHLAAIAGLSDYHFSRTFKRATGLSPSQYFIRLRMSRARHLLLETAHSVIDIGLEVGYSSPSHFSQVFRREVGVTPSAYRDAPRGA